MLTCKSNPPSDCRDNGYAGMCGRSHLGCLWQGTGAMKKAEWIVVLTHAGTGRHETRSVWAVDKAEAFKRAFRTVEDATWQVTHAVQMTPEDQELIDDLNWWAQADNEEEAQLDRERESFNTFVLE